MMNAPRCTVVAILAMLACGLRGHASPDGGPPEGEPAAPAAPDEWEKDILAFEEVDRASPPPPDGVLFLGSSSVRKWDLERWFPGAGFLNRGFGGSQIADSVRHFDRLVTACRPRLVVFYAGDNDVNKGKSAREVFRDFRSFVDLLRDRLPETRLIYLPIKPSIDRWHLWPEMRTANALIEGYCASDDRLFVAGTAEAMLASGEPPAAELFVDDGLHLSPAGYDLWAGCLRAVEAFPEVALPAAVAAPAAADPAGADRPGNAEEEAGTPPEDR